MRAVVQCSDALSNFLELASHGCGMNEIAQRFLEWTERWASDAPAGLPWARGRPATKTDAGFIA
jgi:hypothetical protein